MEFIIYIFIFCLGLVLGSFLNVVGTRLSIGKGINNPKRSYCETCNHTLHFLDMIPVISFLFNKGRCRYCKTKLSYFYPITELLCGFLYVTSYKVFGFSYEFGVSVLLSSLLIMVMVSDINYLIIPDEIIIGISVLLIILSLVFTSFLTTATNMFYGALMFGFMYLLMCFGNFIFKKETLGGADIKLMFIMGFVIGPLPSLFAIFLASVIALPISIILMFRNKENIIPYGPFLVLSLVFIYFFNINSEYLINMFSLF